jgi:hypothetical protein
MPIAAIATSARRTARSLTNHFIIAPTAMAPSCRMGHADHLSEVKAQTNAQAKMVRSESHNTTVHWNSAGVAPAAPPCYNRGGYGMNTGEIRHGGLSKRHGAMAHGTTHPH